MPKYQLREVEKELLLGSASELIDGLASKKKLAHVRQMAFEYYNADSNETFQVQVTVTRDESDFLDVFQTEEMTVHHA